MHLIATPDSVWVRAFYDAEKMSRARPEFLRRLPDAQPQQRVVRRVGFRFQPNAAVV